MEQITEAIERGLVVENADGTLNYTPELEHEMPELHAAMVAAQLEELSEMLDGFYRMGLIEIDGIGPDGEFIYKATGKGLEALDQA